MAEEYLQLQDEVDGLPQLVLMDDDGFRFFDGEQTELEQMLSVFDEIQQELKIEENQIVEEYEKLLDHEERDLCSRVEQLHTDEVICPLCKKHPLMENKTVIFCKCDFRINVEADALTIRDIKTSLDEGQSMHEANCAAEPEFSQVTELAGIDNIVMTCQACDFMHIVI
ncbi:RPA-interacting protein B-like [Lineus longissimus]|uniref:RPA-interacting protein B-like n=1 Tax=Lineus longissimus TaxID=88925 RepID=UPI00315CDF73